MRDRADSLAEDNADLEAKLKTAADAHPSCGLLDDCASECRCAEREQNLMARAEKAEAEVVGLRRGSPSLLQTVATAERERERDEARREAAAMREVWGRLRERVVIYMNGDGHDGDEESGQHYDDCGLCLASGLVAGMDAALSADAGKDYVPRV